MYYTERNSKFGFSAALKPRGEPIANSNISRLTIDSTLGAFTWPKNQILNHVRYIRLSKRFEMSTISEAVQKQHNFFLTGKTKDYSYRLEQLKKLKRLIYKYEKQIEVALKEDLHKSQSESFLEIFLCVQEVNEAIKNLKSWMKHYKLPGHLALFPSKTIVTAEPYGKVLIIGPWNYPFVVTLVPLVGAIASGNCVVLKPSELAPHSADLIQQILSEFPEESINVFTGGPEVSEDLLKEKFDSIFFTGGTTIGKIIMKAAAENLTPVTLELGGKSPCIIDSTADLNLAARRIAWSKFTNAGQTCIAPDYLCVHQNVKYALIQKIIDEIKKFYGENPLTSEVYSHIVNTKHFNRLLNLMNPDQVIYGGKSDPEHLVIAPTLLDRVSWNDPIMQEEIFGPILPILTYNNLNDLLVQLQKSKPLSLYLFTKDEQVEKEVLTKLQFGNGCVNDCFNQFNSYMPFGGIGSSGMGNYKGKWSFDTFSQKRPVLKRSGVYDLFFFILLPKTPRKPVVLSNSPVGYWEFNSNNFIINM